MTTLVVSMMPTDLRELDPGAARAWESGAEAIEVRIDRFVDDPKSLAAYLKRQADRTWIVTCRSASEGGHFDGDADARVALLVAATEGTGAYIDFEFADWQKRPDLHDDVLRASGTKREGGRRLILSAHDFGGAGVYPALRLPSANSGPGSAKLGPASEQNAEDCEATSQESGVRSLVRRIHEVSEAPVAKIAYRIDHICDSFDALDLIHEHGSAVTAIAMGDRGLWTRVLAKKLGAFASYCALETDAATAPGQLSLDEMVTLYRWSAIDAETKVFGVIGDPVAHSMSPCLHNRWLAEAGINGVYLPLRVGRHGDGVRRFLDGCRDRPWLDVCGISVTIPHKASALQWVGEGADPMANWIGAANTLHFTTDRVHGYNTDSYAAVASLVDALGCARSDLAGLPVDLLGSGGAALAVAHGLYECGCRLTVYSRSPEKSQRLAGDYGAVVADWGDRTDRAGEVLINCTSVGMGPRTDPSPMPRESLRGCRLVFDLIYNPLETRLLRDAAAAGANTLNGLDMFVRQAAMQFELWTGSAPDVERAHGVLRDRISGSTQRAG